MMNPGFITSNFSCKKSIFVFSIVLETFYTDVFFSGCFMLDGEHFRHPTCPNLSVAKLSDDGRK